MMKYILVVFLLNIWNISCSQKNECTILDKKIKGEIIYQKTDKLPSFQMEGYSMLGYINEKIHQKEYSEFIGLVIIVVVIGADGNVLSAKIKDKEETEYLDLENDVVNAFLSMSNWQPGICNLQKVAVELIIPIRFSP